MNKKLILNEDLLDEALPRELILDLKNHTGFDGGAIDIQNSNAEAISPEEAMELYKTDYGKATDLIFMIKGHPVKFNDHYWRIDDMEDIAPEKTKAKSGRRYYDTEDMPFDHLVSIADKIYKVDTAYKDYDKLKAREQNSESPNNGGFFSDDPRTIYNHRVLSTKGDIRAIGLRPDINHIKNEIFEREKKIADKERDMKNNPDLNNSRNNGYIKRWKEEIKELRAKLKNDPDKAARLRYFDSEYDLSKKTDEYRTLKKGITSTRNLVNRALKDLEDTEAGDSPKSRKLKKDLNWYKERVSNANRALLKLELQIDNMSEEDLQKYSWPFSSLKGYEKEIRGSLKNVAEIEAKLEAEEGKDQEAIDKAKAKYDKLCDTLSKKIAELDTFLGRDKKKTESLLIGKKLTLYEGEKQESLLTGRKLILPEDY